MKLEALRWLGVATDQPEALVSFPGDMFGLRVEFAEPTATEPSLHSGDRVQAFGPSNAYHDVYRSQGIVPLFELSDVRAARRKLKDAGVEVGDWMSDGAREWIDARAPDGRLYELASVLNQARLSETSALSC